MSPNPGSQAEKFILRRRGTSRRTKCTPRYIEAETKFRDRKMDFAGRVGFGDML